MIKTLRNLFKQDKEKFVVPKSVQAVIPIKTIWEDGIFLVGKNKYAKTFKFEDINYAVASREDKEAMLHCDANKMQRVFDNLLRNAAIYSYSDTEITITTELRANKVTIVFENCGANIPEEKLEQIFEQFYRVDTARSMANGGAGLGLAIAKHIVELHKGTIAAKSKDECVKFIVELPLS